MIRGSASADVKPGGAAATSALSLRSSSVHKTAAMGLEFMCCLNLKHTKNRFSKQILKLATLLLDDDDDDDNNKNDYYYRGIPISQTLIFFNPPANSNQKSFPLFSQPQ